MKKSLKRHPEICQQIDDFMKHLPSETLLKYAETQYLIEAWLQQRNSAIQFGKLLKARFGGGGGNPAYLFLESGEIDEIDYHCLTLLVDFYDLLFALIQSSWHFIHHELQELSQKVVLDYPRSETEYFLWLLRDEYDNRYKKTVEGYCFKAKSFEEEAKAIKNACRKTRLDYSDLSLLKSQHQESSKGFYFLFALNIASKYSHQDSTLSEKIARIRQYIAQLGDLALRACRQERTEKPPRRIRTHKVYRGELYVGARGAGWKRM